MSQPSPITNMYAEIGKAMSLWSNVEFSLSRVFATCLASKHDWGAHAVFYAVENFRSKLQMVDAIISISLKENPESLHWKSDKQFVGLNERCIQQSKIRNKLAHYTLHGFGTHKPDRMFMLAPPMFDPKSHKNWGKDGMTIKHIVAAQKSFTALSYALDNFAARIDGFPELHAGYQKRLPRPQGNHNQEAPTHAEPGPPPEPSQA